MVNILNSNNFDETTKKDGFVIVDFYADWCGPCKMMSPIIDQIAEENVPNLTVGKVNCDDNTDLAEKFQVMTIPTIMVFKNGEVIKTFIGVTPKEEILSTLK